MELRHRRIGDAQVRVLAASDEDASTLDLPLDARVGPRHDARAQRERSGLGGACDAEWTFTCKDGFACGPDEKCASKVKVGDACSFQAQCPEDYDCKGTCVLGKLPGAACVESDLCIGGVCNTVAGTCNGDCLDPG